MELPRDWLSSDCSSAELTRNESAATSTSRRRHLQLQHDNSEGCHVELRALSAVPDATGLRTDALAAAAGHRAVAVIGGASLGATTGGDERSSPRAAAGHTARRSGRG